MSAGAFSAAAAGRRRLHASSPSRPAAAATPGMTPRHARRTPRHHPGPRRPTGSSPRRNSARTAPMSTSMRRSPSLRGASARTAACSSRLRRLQLSDPAQIDRLAEREQLDDRDGLGQLQHALAVARGDRAHADLVLVVRLGAAAEGAGGHGQLQRLGGQRRRGDLHRLEAVVRHLRRRRPAPPGSRAARGWWPGCTAARAGGRAGRRRSRPRS